MLTNTNKPNVNDVRMKVRKISQDLPRCIRTEICFVGQKNLTPFYSTLRSNRHTRCIRSYTLEKNDIATVHVFLHASSF
jgi:hypothetical protein